MKKTLTYLYIAISVPFLVILIFLFRFQIVEGEKYRRISEHNFVRVQRVLPVRGEIYDRNFNPIAVNKASTNLYILPVRIQDLSKVAEFVAKHFFIGEQEIRKMIYEQRFRSYQEILLVQNVDYEKVVEISEQLVDYPSLSFRNEFMRSYEFDNHFTGYVNRISRAEFNRLRDEDYSINSLIGKTGIEKQYEQILKGSVGYEVIQVDATGRNFQLFKHDLSTPAINGSDILLTIDGRLQRYVESIFPEDRNGAVVVIDTRTGGILSYVSKPTFNLNMFSEIIGSEHWNTLVNDPSSPLLDRVTSANYAPASVFKPLVAAAALDSDIVCCNTHLQRCTGSYRFGNRTFNCWQERGHGSLNLIDAIKHSCNVYFYDLSRKLELSLLFDFIMDNRLMSVTGIDLPSERRGFFPNEDWYRQRNITGPSITGHKINLAIGQGEVLFTPLQIASLYAAFANDGLWRKPYLFSRVISSKRNNYAETAGHQTQQDPGNQQDSQPALLRKEKQNPQVDKSQRTESNLNISQDTIAIIQDALYKAVNEQGGTGGGARARGVNVYGKTGTGQNPGGEGPNTLFAGYAAWQEPEIALAVVIENVPDGTGGRTAAPFAGRIIRYYDEFIR